MVVPNLGMTQIALFQAYLNTARILSNNVNDMFSEFTVKEDTYFDMEDTKSNKMLLLILSYSVR